MLRRRPLGRDPSICAFCQYRLALRLGPSRYRGFSSTTTLQTGERTSLNGDGTNSRTVVGVSLPRRPVGSGSWSSRLSFVKRSQESKADTPVHKDRVEAARQTPNATTQQSSVLSESELQARTEMLARQKPTAPKAKPGSITNPLPRHLWDPEKQQAIHESLKGPPINESKSLFSGSATRDLRSTVKQEFDHVTKRNTANEQGISPFPGSSTREQGSNMTQEFNNVMRPSTAKEQVNSPFPGSSRRELGSNMTQEFNNVTRRSTGGPLDVSLSRTTRKSPDDLGGSSSLASILGTGSFSSPEPQRIERVQPRSQPPSSTLSSTSTQPRSQPFPSTLSSTSTQPKSQPFPSTLSSTSTQPRSQPFPSTLSSTSTQPKSQPFPSTLSNTSTQPKSQLPPSTLSSTSTNSASPGTRSGWGNMANLIRSPYSQRNAEKSSSQDQTIPSKDATHSIPAATTNESPKPTFSSPLHIHRIRHPPAPSPDNKINSSQASTQSSTINDVTPAQQTGTTTPGRSNNMTSENNSWGLLTRKSAPEKTSSKDFWSAMSKNFNDGSKSESKSESKVPADWGLEYDRTIQYRKVPDAPSENGASLIPDPVQDILDSKLGVVSSISKNPRRAENFEVEPKEERKTAGRDAVRDSYEIKKGRKDKSKRYGRSSRYEDDMYEDDDAFDHHAEQRRLKAERKAQKEAERTRRTAPIPIHLPELISITALADALKVKHNIFLEQLGELGFEGVTLDSLMAGETAALVAQEYGFEPYVDVGASRDLKPRPPPENPSLLPPRPPVITIMGHVDHGKTTLLDYLRKSSVAAQEHGGITQHIGAFSVSLSSGKVMTFLDTPGHAAFLTMRERGALVTDIVVLVVAADDSVKPQTIEAIKHARAHKVPIIVAISKIDADGAGIDQVKADLARNGLEIEDFGGDVQVVLVSAKTGQGMHDLEENILTLSEILDMRAEADGPAEGWVLESSLKSIGKTATVLVKRGTLRPGDHIAAGLTWAKIRSMRNEAGADVLEAPPGSPVEIMGWRDLPAAGDQVIQGENEDSVKAAVDYREGLREREKDAADHEAIAEARRQHQERRAREKAIAEDAGFRAPVGGNWNSRKASLYLQAKQQAAEAVAAASAAEDLDGEGNDSNQESGTKIVNFVVKGDVHGSVEAVCAAIQEIGNHEVQPRVLRFATGPITEFDVEHAAASGSTIVNFATATPSHVRRMAEDQGVKVLDHNVIYHLVDDVKATLNKFLAPEISSSVLGEAEVLQLFPINIKGRVYKTVAGCRVRNGVVSRGALYRVFRGGSKIYDGKLETLKNVKKDVSEMRKGSECGIGFEDFQDLKVGDLIQAYEEVRTDRTLD